MNWIDKALAGETKVPVANVRRILEQIEAGEASTPTARKVQDYLARYANGDAKFALWLALVDTHVGMRAHVGLFDLGDWPMRDAFDDGMSPGEAAVEALRNDDTFGSL